MWKSRSFATPDCQFFEIHGSKFKPHPACNPGQTSVVCITHGVFFLCIRKGTFNRLFSFGVNLLPHICFSDLLCQIQIFLPDVCLQNLLSFCVCSTLPATWTSPAFFGCASVYSFSFFGRCGVTKRFPLGAGKGVRGWIISVIPGAVSVFSAGSARIGKNGNSVVIQNLLYNPGCLICRIHSEDRKSVV